MRFDLSLTDVRRAAQSRGRIGPNLQQLMPPAGSPPRRRDAPPGRVTLGERILLALSREENPEPVYGGGYEGDRALYMLQREFPDLKERIAGRKVLDFGSGVGDQSVALAQLGAGSVVGLDTNAALLPQARGLAERNGVADRVVFAERLDPSMLGTFDVVISQNAMEHFDDPAGVLAEIKRALKPGGELLLTFGPPWYAPSGSHMGYFAPIPWMNLLFSERTIMRVRARYRDDAATRYEEVEGGLNQMTVAKFERLVAESGLVVKYRKYGSVRGIDVLGKLPVLRELFVNLITVVLAKP